MRALNLVTGLMVAGLFAAAPAFAESSSMQANPAPKAGKQQTQEGGPSSQAHPCSSTYNANPSADPNCNPSAGTASGVQK